jgi:hypothetical protein
MRQPYAGYEIYIQLVYSIIQNNTLKTGEARSKDGIRIRFYGEKHKKNTS